ncbi:MAG: glycosyltransferase family 4 protein [Candidatus Methanomethylicaceae archaeon]
MGIDSDKPRILVAQLGARRRYAVPVALHQAGMLGLLVTDVTANDLVGRLARVGQRIWPNAFLKKLASRQVGQIPPEKIKTFPWFGLRRRLRAIVKEGKAVRLRHARDNARFAARVAKLALNSFDAVYVFNGAGLEIARAAKEAGIKVILDQTSAPVRVEEQILAEERKRWPGWEPASVVNIGWELLAEREEAEWELADIILCGSQYVHDALVHAGVPSVKCRVVSTGVCPKPPFEVTSGLIDKRFRERIVLFAGTLCLQKGIPYLVEAARQLKGFARVVAVGPSMLSEKALSYVREVLDYRGNLPPRALWEEYRSAGILVLPTLSEGSANVCFEALAAAVPVITTLNAGSIIEGSQDGFIVPIRDGQAIAQASQHAFENQETYSRMAERCITKAARFSTTRYHLDLAAALQDMFRP